MKANKYLVKTDFILEGKLFLIGDIIYVSESRLNCNVLIYLENRSHTRTISDADFKSNYEQYLEKQIDAKTNTQAKLINIFDDLPPVHDKEYLCLKKHECEGDLPAYYEFKILLYDSYHNCWYKRNEVGRNFLLDCGLNGVTHWMELPELPK